MEDKKRLFSTRIIFQCNQFADENSRIQCPKVYFIFSNDYFAYVIPLIICFHADIFNNLFSLLFLLRL